MSLNDKIENTIRSLPAPVLALAIMVIATVIFMLISPPHTICDTQKEVLIEKQTGNIFKNKKEKKQLPPLLIRTKETCLQGVSSGACYEYFNSLRRLTRDLSEANSECLAEFFSQEEIKTSIKDGLEVMTRLAWGQEPPESALYKKGWLLDSDLILYCKMLTILRTSIGEKNLSDFQKEIIKKLPSEKPSKTDNPEDLANKPPSALEKLGETEVMSRSLFSSHCGQPSSI